MIGTICYCSQSLSTLSFVEKLLSQRLVPIPDDRLSGNVTVQYQNVNWTKNKNYCRELLYHSLYHTITPYTLTHSIPTHLRTLTPLTPSLPLPSHSHTLTAITLTPLTPSLPLPSHSHTLIQGIDGSTGSLERDKLINGFNSPSNKECWVFLLSTKYVCTHCSHSE